jgi:hypothetical protein
MAVRIHLTDGGIVGIAAAPAADGGIQATALHVHGRETPQERADAEVRLDEEELTELVRELVAHLPAPARQRLLTFLQSEGAGDASAQGADPGTSGR